MNITRFEGRHARPNDRGRVNGVTPHLAFETLIDRLTGPARLDVARTDS